MSQASKLRKLLRRISETEALLYDLRSQAVNPAAGQFLTCLGCQKQHFVAAGHNLPSNWWHDDAPENDPDWGRSYMCSDCSRKEEEEMVERGWKRAGRTRGEKRRAKELAAQQRTRAYWETVVVFQNPRNMCVYRGTRMQMFGCVCDCGCEGGPKELDLSRLERPSDNEVVLNGWTTIIETLEPVPQASVEEWYVRKGITLID